ncbi:MAG: hypothetical protein ACPL4H_00195, partial [Anaerolineales bacterium]
MYNKIIKNLIVFLIIAMIATACAPQATPAPEVTQPPAAATEAPAATEVPTQITTEQPTEAPQATQEPIKIGFFSPTTGFAAADGTSALQAAQLAVK